MQANKKDSKGATQNQHIKALIKMGAPVPEIKLTPVIEELDYLKTYWLQCQRGKVISYQELFSFQQVMQINLQPWESSIIMQIDNIYWKPGNGNNSLINSKGRIGRSRDRNK